MPQIHTRRRPQAHVYLQTLDGSQSVKLQLVNSRGQDDPLGIRAAPYPRQATQIRTGEGSLDDNTPPYYSRQVETFDGGMLQEYQNDDRTRYRAGYRMDTQHTGQAIPGPLEYHQAGVVGGTHIVTPTEHNFLTTYQGLYSTERFYATQFTQAAIGTLGRVWVLLRKEGTPADDITVAVYSEAAGAPSVAQASDTLTVANGKDYLQWFAFDLSFVYGIANYWIVIDGGSGATSTDHWQVPLSDTSGTGATSSNGSSWVDTGGVYFHHYVHNNDDEKDGIFFEYKRAMYYVSRTQDKSRSELYMNGDRGVADGTSTTTQLDDTTKSWDTDEWAGNTLLITGGTGADASQPYATIASNTATALTLDTALLVAPDITSEYVILGSDTWQLLASGLGTVTDIAATDEYIFVARGADSSLQRYRYYNNAGTWVDGSANEPDFNADYLLALRGSNNQLQLWGGLNDHPLHGHAFWRANVPSKWGSLYRDYGEIFPTDRPWDSVDHGTTPIITDDGDAQVTIDATTGYKATLDRAEALDIRHGDAVGFFAKSDSALTSGDLQLHLADTTSGSELRPPDSVYWSEQNTFHQATAIFEQLSMDATSNRALAAPLSVLVGQAVNVNKARQPKAVRMLSRGFREAKYALEEDPLGTFIDKSGILNSSGGSGDTVHLNSSNDWFYVGADVPFAHVQFTFGTTKNSNAATMSIQQFDGNKFTAVTLVTDGTSSAGKTWAQNGTMEFTPTHDWPLSTVDGKSAYWIRMKPSANLTANIDVYTIWVKNTLVDFLQDDVIDGITQPDSGSGILTEFDWDDDYQKDWLCVCADEPFNWLYFLLSGNVNNNSATLDLEVYDGGLWRDVQGDSDGTSSGGATLAQSGAYTFDMPMRWEQYTIDNVTGYWLRLRASAMLDAVRITGLRVQNRDTYAFWDITDRVADGGTVNSVDHSAGVNSMATTDGYFVCQSEPFTSVRFDVVTANTNSGSLAVRVWDGQQWYTMPSLTDNTSSGGIPYAQDGNVTFDAPSFWTTRELNGQTGYWAFIYGAANDAEIRSIRTKHTGKPQYRDLTAAMGRDGDTIEPGTGLQLYADVGAGLLICYQEPFKALRYRVGTGGLISATLSGDYMSSSGWNALPNFVDNSKSGGQPWVIDPADAYWDTPADWQPHTIEGVTGYWMRFQTTATMQVAHVYNMLVQPVVDDTYLPIDSWLVPDTLSSQAVMNYTGLDGHPYIYVGGTEQFSRINFNMATANTTAGASVTVQYWSNQNGWSNITVSSDTTVTASKPLGQDGYIEWDTMPADWHPYEINGTANYFVRLDWNGGLDETTAVDYIRLSNQNGMVLDIPNMTADEWTWVSIAFPAATNDAFPPNMGTLKSARLYNATAVSCVFQMSQGIHLVGTRPEMFSLGSDSRITNMLAYGQVYATPWIFTETRPYEVQIDPNSDTPSAAPLPLEELGGLRSPTNGAAAASNDVYMYFNMSGQNLQRYSSGSLENVGFNKDEGMPADMQGEITAIATYPGRVFVSTRAKDATSYASLLVRRGSGWHEMYRAPMGRSIRDIQIQVVDGSATDRIWLDIDGRLIALPLPSFTFDPTGDPAYRYWPESNLVTGWYTYNYRSIEKLFTDITLISENLVASDQTITIAYQTDQGELDSGWTDITPVFTDSPYQKENIATATTTFATGTRIRFRFTLRTNDVSIPPVLQSTVLDSIINLPVKNNYTVRFRLSDDDRDSWGSIDRDGNAQDNLSLLETWYGTPAVPLIMHTGFSTLTEDAGRMVVIQPPGIQPISTLDSRTQTERSIFQMVLLEI